MKKQPLVCIVITDWNNGKTIFECLRTLIDKTSYKNYKVIIVDNASTDGSPEKIEEEFRKSGKVIVVRAGDNLGFTKGTNYGWTYSFKNLNPDYICDMNADLFTVQPEWLKLMVEELEKDEKRGICGNKLVFPDGRLQLLYSDRHPEEYKEKDKGQYDFVKEVTSLGGANMLIKASMIKKIGALDESFFYGPDDVDYCLRARKKGFKVVYTGLSKSTHIGSFTYLSNKDFLYKHQSYGMIVFAFRHGTFIDGIKMILNQFVRVFITRKDPFQKRKLKNIYFHTSFPRRFMSFLSSSFKAVRNYNVVKNDYFKLK